ncbi:MAG TPA: ferric reductase-like transmembrane domain-containing protein [Acidimicrobiales bacterium]|nr:ferric reductase-like transmembrane domain-containing protein [Acidimicrobiales bacterium]
MSSTSLWYATRASGLTALILLTLTMVMGIGTSARLSTRNWPGFAQQELHRRISMLAVVFLGIHVLTSVLDTYVHIGLAAVVVPFTSGYDRFWVGVGTVALDAMIAVWITSLLRGRMRPGAWRAVHWLAYLSWPVALAHAFGMGTDAGEGWVLVLGMLCVASVGAALAWRTWAARRQAVARAGLAATRGVPEKHLSLTGPTNRGSRRA